MNHFVVLKSVTGKGINIHDPASGAKFYPLAEASKHLSGVGVELSPTESFVRQDERHRLPFSVFFSSLRGGGGALAQVFVLSLVLQALVLAAPFYMQLTIDEVVARGDIDLLIVLALGFGLLTLIRVATTAVRSLILVVVQNTLHFNLGARLFRHLIRLPISYFEKRHIGGIQSRFASLEPIRNLLAEGIITAAIDGLMADCDAGHDLHLQPATGHGGAHGAVLLRGAAARPVSHSVAAHRGLHPGRGAGKHQLHRNRSRHPASEAAQPRERT
jgi:ATP-binding cassette, subfamily B, bacterial CvaB/MchF/RaxB